jgi:hypothetical protein
VLCLSPSTSNGHDVSRDIISHVPNMEKMGVETPGQAE